LGKEYFMSTIELKEKLIGTILHTENTELLEEVFRLLELESDEIKTIKLTQQQKRAIIAGQKEIENGHFLTNEQTDKEIDEWLKE